MEPPLSACAPVSMENKIKPAGKEAGSMVEVRQGRRGVDGGGYFMGGGAAAG